MAKLDDLSRTRHSKVFFHFSFFFFSLFGISSSARHGIIFSGKRLHTEGGHHEIFDTCASPLPSARDLESNEEAIRTADCVGAWTYNVSVFCVGLCGSAYRTKGYRLSRGTASAVRTRKCSSDARKPRLDYVRARFDAREKSPTPPLTRFCMYDVVSGPIEALWSLTSPI